MKPLALIKCGGTLPQTVPRHGDFEEWFAHALGDLELQQIDVFRGEAPYEPGHYSGVLVTGSVSMVSDQEDWMEATAHWLGGAVRHGLPTLGVCFGHQLIAYALGGNVGPNPSGRQIGTRPIALKPAAASDPLFGTLPSAFSVQTSHLQRIIELPDGAVVLGETPLDPNFAIRFADNSWGVQFHPEFSAEVTRDYIRIRKAMLREEGFDPDDLLAQVEETVIAQRLLRRFAALVSQDAMERALA